MPITTYTIATGDSEETCDALGIEHSSAKLTRRGTGHASFMFTTVPSDFAGEPVIAEGAEISLYQRALDEEGEIVADSGRRLFCGTVQRVRRQLTPGGMHFHLFQCANRMLELEQANYHQKQYFQDGSVDEHGHRLNNTGVFFTRDVLVPFDHLLGQLTTQEQVHSCLSYAIADVIPPVDLQIGTINLAPAGYEGGSIPLRQFQGPKVAEVIRVMTDASPDSVTWIDDATLPPTFHVSRWGDLPEVTLAIGSTVRLIREGLDIEPLDDLVADGVLFQFRRVDEMDGVSGQYLVYQSASAAGYFTWEGNQSVPPLALTGRELNCVCDTFDMAGVKVNVLRSEVEVEANAFSTVEWWRSRNSQLDDARVSHISINDLSVWVDGEKLSPAQQAELFARLPGELVFGSITDWMLATNWRPSGVSYQTIELRCRAGYKKWSTDLWEDLVEGTLPKEDLTAEAKWVPFHVDGVIVTDAVTQVYRENVVDQHAEAIPEGLARWFWEAARVRQWAGSIIVAGEDFLDAVNVGQRLNLSGGHAEWLTMRALVTQVDFELGEERAVVSFGPPRGRNARDRIDFLKLNRVQGRRTTGAGAVQSGVADGSRTITQSAVTARWNSTSGFTGGTGGTSGWVLG